ncbi:hypothetical protein PAMA_014733 [Pampus argenteus]
MKRFALRRLDVSPDDAQIIFQAAVCVRGKQESKGPPQAPSRPLYRALMGCGIDRPSVTVSRWITVSGRETQKREEDERRREERLERSRRRRRRVLLRDSSVSAVRLCVPPGNLPRRLICATRGAQRPWGLRATEPAMYQDVSGVGVAIPVLSHHGYTDS